MIHAAIEQGTARAEGRATVGTDLSADPGAKTEGRASHSVARLSPLRDWHQSDKSLAAQPRVLDVKTPGDGLPDIAYPDRPVLHFTLNHYKSTTRMASAQGRLLFGPAFEEAIEFIAAVPDPAGVFGCPELPLCPPVI